MGNSQGWLRAATGVMLIGAALAVLPSASRAAAPPAPNYECSTAARPRAGAVKVMIAGDSITNSSAGDYTWPYWLWRDQHGRGAKIDFVGDWNGTFDINTGSHSSRAYLDCDFDQDKEARSGVKLWTAQSNKIGLGSKVYSKDPLKPSYPGHTSWMRGAANRFKPHVLVLFAGSNDLFTTTGEPIKDKSEAGIASFVISKLKIVIAQARLGSPGIDIILTTVPAAGGKNSRYNLYNAKLATVAKKMNTKSQKVVVAKIPSWEKNSWDGAHPNALGEVAIAAAIDDKLHAVNSKLLARPKKLAKPAIGPRFRAVLKGSKGSRAGTVNLSWTLPPGADRTIIYVRKAGGSWVKRADLVKTSLRTAYPNDGTEAFPTRQTEYTVDDLTQGSNYEFMVRLGKGHAISPLYSSIVTVRSPTGLG